MRISYCRVCDSPRLESAIDLGNQPWCNHFLRPEAAGSEPRYPLHVVYCSDCSTAQLDYTVPKEVMFGDHTYLSGTTKSLAQHFRQVAEDVDQRFLAGVTAKSVLDIGSNDGTQLKSYRDLGCDILGVEPSLTSARLAVQQGIPTINRFFNLQTLREIGRKFHVINASGVFFHLEELHSVTDAIREGLRDDGVMVVQFLYMKSILENHAFDQIYHEHLLYYTLRTIQALLRRHGLELFDAHLAPIHGGSIIGFIAHQGKRAASERLMRLVAEEEASSCNSLLAYRDLAVAIVTMKERDLNFLSNARDQGLRTYGMGAPAKGNTLLNTFGITPTLISRLVEKNPLRKGLVSPGMHIPICLESELDAPPNVYYVLAWNFRDEILRNNQHLIDRGVRFYFPIQPKGQPA